MKIDPLLDWLTRLAAFTVGLMVVLIIGFLVRESWSAIHVLGVSRFFTDTSWHPLSSQFNLLPMIVTSLMMTFGAVLIASPIGIAAAIYCNFYSSKYESWVYRRFAEILSGIPSVVFGLWGLVTLAPLLSGLGGSGQSFGAGVIVLAIMILPTIAFLSDAAIQQVPENRLQGAAALGLSKWTTIRRIVLHEARFGIGNGILLATGRAIGETMAVLMVAGNVVQFPVAFTKPVRTLTSNIALEMGYATQDHRSVLFASGLVLLVVVAVLVFAAEILRRKQVAQ